MKAKDLSVVVAGAKWALVIGCGPLSAKGCSDPSTQPPTTARLDGFDADVGLANSNADDLLALKQALKDALKRHGPQFRQAAAAAKKAAATAKKAKKPRTSRKARVG